MRLLADESCDFRVVQALRAAGHDVLAIVEIAPGFPDDAVLDLARREKRLFLTEDRDFGQLAYAASEREMGVILLRYPSWARTPLPRAAVDFIRTHGEALAGRFAVLQPGRVRIAPRIVD